MATDAVLAYERRHAGRRLLIALNFTGEPQSVDIGRGATRLLLSTDAEQTRRLLTASVVLRANEGIIVAAS
jgi:hypothetical protein